MKYLERNWSIRFISIILSAHSESMLLFATKTFKYFPIYAHYTHFQWKIVTYTLFLCIIYISFG